jgi:dUTP pyrophosphatase
MDKIDTIMSTFPEYETIKPLMELIEQVMSIPEETLTDDSIDIVSGMIKGAFTPKIKEDSINELLNEFKKSHLSTKEVSTLISDGKKAITELVDELKPSTHKRAILNSIFDFIFEIYDIVEDKYNKYDIELNMKLDEGAQLPTYAHETDACADIYALKDTTIPAHSLSTKVSTGLRIALPEGWVAKIAPRSSIGMKTGLRLSNSIGIIDADYRGEIGVLYDNFSDSDYEIKAGDRIAQIWIEPVHRFKPVKVDILPTTERGENGFGSSGK